MHHAAGRILQLDLLRCLAIVLVLCRHTKPFPDSASNVLHGLTAAATRGGWVGVDVFFVLSGFLVGGSVITATKQGNWSGCRYILRRLTRLWIVIVPALRLDDLRCI